MCKLNSTARDLNDPIFIFNEYLQICHPSGNVDSSEVTDIAQSMINAKAVKEKHQSKIYTRKDGRVFTRIKEEGGATKQIIAKDEKELYRRLYDYYFGSSNQSLEDFFPQWIKYRHEMTNKRKKTIKENEFLWGAYIKGTEIAKLPMKTIKVRHFLQYFRMLTKDYNVTRKKFNDIKSILNGVISYAIEEEIISHNPILEIQYRQFDFMPQPDPVDPFSIEERQKILDHLGDNDLYSLAIKMAFHLLIRIGELKALRWSNIKGNTIYVHSYMDYNNDIVPHLKGKKKIGRYLPITDSCKDIINNIKKLNPDGEFLFIKDEMPLTTITFNRKFKKCCEELNIEYRSSHQIRFSTASIMYDMGVAATELQVLLGHTTLSMTLHYLRNITPPAETQRKMNKILG